MRKFFCFIFALLPRLLAAQEIEAGDVVFDVTPSGSLVHIEKKILETDKGPAVITLRNGHYSYKVTGNRLYHALTGTVDVRGGVCTLKLSLPHAYGALRLSGDGSPSAAGASVYVDDVFRGIAPMVADSLSGGAHKVKVVQKYCLPYETEVDIPDESTFELVPSFEPNFSIVRIHSVRGADIAVNGEKYGTGEWTGRMEPGVYRISATMASHTPVTRVVEVVAGKDDVDIPLDAPEPIYGSLRVDCSAAWFSSQAYLDGELLGTIPMQKENILQGRHVLTVKRRKGTPDQVYSCNVIIIKDQTTVITESDFQNNFSVQ